MLHSSMHTLININNMTCLNHQSGGCIGIKNTPIKTIKL
jgi:hypothetical protein